MAAEQQAASPPIAVLHLLGPLRPSGMERMLVSASSAFRDLGIMGTVVGQGSRHPFKAEILRAGYGVLEIPPVRSVAGQVALAALLKASAANVVHIHTEAAFGPAAALCRLMLPRAAVVRTVHSVFAATDRRSRMSRRAQARLGDPFTSTFVAISPAVASNERAFGRSTTTIFNWVDDRFHAAERDPASIDVRLAVMIGNPAPVKNHGAALRALVRTRLRLAYFGDEANATLEERGQLDLLASEGRLVHRGVGDPLPALLKAAVFLLPSRNEGMSVALAEALTVGVPALVNDLPGIQWARSFPDVTFLPIDDDAWHDWLTRYDAGGQEIERAADGSQPPDLRAVRGAEEYAAVYGVALAERPKRRESLGS